LKQADVVEQTLGVADDPNAAKRFLQIDDLTDSEEEQMEESDSDRDECNDPLSQSADMGNAESTLEPPAKRRALGAVSNEATAASQVPKWSNPDPYTSLPPVDEIRKKKDVVKFIRKARVAMERDVMVTNQAGINDDFISFGFEDTASIKETAPGSASRGIEDQDERELAVGASDPKRFSHLENLHGQQILKAPGTEDMPLSTDIKGPPLIPQSRPLPLPDRVTFEKTLRDPDDALGSRKRTHDDVIKDPPEKMIRSRRSFLEISSGSLLDPWLPGINSNPIPWLDRSARRCENMGFRYSSAD
jgi:non-canonical poly(A) RNA polymerase PAPD5/7